MPWPLLHFNNTTKITRRKRDRTNENFLKRVKSLLKKSNSLTEDNANVYLRIPLQPAPGTDLKDWSGQDRAYGRTPKTKWAL